MTGIKTDSRQASQSLLGCDDPPVVVVTNQGGRSPFLLLGDHAGRAVPKSLAGLGLTAEAMDLHIAWDIGVAGLGERLAAALDACFIRQSYSRLVIDCNRRPGAEGSIAEVSDGVAIPGNAGLNAAQAIERRAAIYQPYQDAIAAELDRRSQAGRPTALVSLHSFTPVFQGHVRPWKMGVLHRNDSTLSTAMLGLLKAALGEQAGDNQPYSLNEIDNTIPLHADARGLDYLELEVRQDLIGEPEGQAWAATLIAHLLPRALASAAERR